MKGEVFSTLANTVAELAEAAFYVLELDALPVPSPELADSHERMRQQRMERLKRAHAAYEGLRLISAPTEAPK